MLTHKEIQGALARMLFAFADFCDAYGLYYSLSDGTLLGAIRHHGFIPWDDDVDLYMPRPDYERLLALEDELKKETGYDLANAHNRKMPLPFSKVIDAGIPVKERDWRDEYVMQGLWLDIFPIDGLPEDYGDLKRLFARRDVAIRKIWLATLDFHKMDRTLKNCIKGAIAPFFRRYIDPYKLSRQIEADVSAYVFDKAKNVGHVVYETAFRSGVPREAFLQGVPVTFEGRTLNAMSCWDDMLTKEYGDYMQMPPEDQRATHSLMTA